MSSPTPPPLPLLFTLRSSPAFILSTLITAVFTDIFLYTVIVPVLPFALSTRAGVPASQVQPWVSILLAAYAAGLVLASPVCGYFADQSPSRRAPFLLGLLSLAGANLLLCFGTSIPVLLVGRALQGMAAAVVWAVGFAMAPETVGGERAGEALGWVSLGINMGALVGPTLGGVVFAKAGYFAVFGMTFGLLGFDVLLRLVMIERKVAVKILEERGGVEGPALVVGGTTEEEGEAGETEPLVGSSEESEGQGKTIGELAKPHPLPLLLFLSVPRFLSALWGIMVLSIMITAFDSVLPLYVYQIFGWQSLGAGLIFLCTCSTSLAEPLLGHWADKHGTRWFGIVCFAGLVAPYLLLRWVVYDAFEQKFLLAAILLVIGGCWSAGMTALNLEISKINDELERESPGIFGGKGAMSQAFGLTNVAFAAGSMIGPIWGGFMKENIGWGNMTTSIGLLSAITIVPTSIWCGRSLSKRKSNPATTDQISTNGYGTV